MRRPSKERVRAWYGDPWYFTGAELRKDSLHGPNVRTQMKGGTEGRISVGSQALPRYALQVLVEIP